MPENDASKPVPLEEMLGAFQKSLARSNEATLDVRKRDLDYLKGHRALYIIDSLEIDLKAAVTVPLDEDGKATQVFVDSQAQPEHLSSIKFTVESSPLEAVKGPKVLLTRTRPASSTPGRNEFTAWVIDSNGPASQQPIDVVFSQANGKGRNRTVALETDSLGKIEFSIDLKTGAFELKNGGGEVDVSLPRRGNWLVRVEALELSSEWLPIQKGN